MKINNYLILYFLLISFIFNAQVKNNLDDEDEDNIQTTKNPTPPKNKKRIIEDDEFDDPNLLHQKQQRNNLPPNMNQQINNNNIPPNNNIQNNNINNNITNNKEDEIIEMNKYKYYLLKYFYEIIVFAFIILFIINVFIGKRKNYNISKLWLKSNLDFFTNNYAHIGADREFNTKISEPLIYDSYNNYKFFASGRVYINWMLVDINLKKRQDLVTLLSNIFIFSEKDKITYEATISPSNELPCIFCICKKKEAKNLKKSFKEIDSFTIATYPSFLDENLVLLCENNEMMETMFKNKQFYNAFQKVESNIDTVFFTDKRNAKDNYAIMFQFNIKINDLYNDLLFKDFTLFVHICIDLLCTLSVKNNYKKEAYQRRKEFDAEKSRELAEKNAEEVRNLKLEKKAKESKKVLTREQAQKLEEKERKEALKNKRKKMFKFVKA
jgi:hypothetical protein